MKKQKNIRLSKSVLDTKEASALRRVILQDGYLGMGQEVRLFEEELGGFIGREAVCVNSGTAALHLAVMSVVKPGDEVLVPSLTFVASFQAISAAGARPVACDIDENALFIDLKDAERRLTKKTKAIMPVHYSGGVGDLRAVYAFAKKHGLRVIEDAAHAFGTTYHEKMIGSIGDIVCFSFDGIKNITSGEGGAVLSSDQQVMDFVKDARLLGVCKDTAKRYQGQRSWEFEVAHQGYRYHMSNLFAAVGRVQLKKFSRFAAIRKKLAQRYHEQLKAISGVELLQRDYNTVVPHIFPIRVKDGRRDELRSFLLEKAIETGVHYYPNHWLEFFAPQKMILPVTERVYGQILSLPLHPDLKLTDQNRVIKAVGDFYGPK